VADREAARAVVSLVGPGTPVWSLAWRADGRTLLSGGGDRIIRRWNVATGEHLGPLVMARAVKPAATGGRGEEVFSACVACHTLRPGEQNRAGPTLHGVFGRRIATLPGYNFSEPLKQLDIVWTAETIDKLFDIGPARFTPGTKMPEQRVPDADRKALVEFLETATR
jgi:cytochrome c